MIGLTGYRGWRVVLGGVALVVLLAACAGDEPAGPPDDADPDDAAAEEEVVSLTVGFLPIAAYVYFWQAQDAGYFAEEGLEVELVPAAGGAAIIPALESGDFDFGVSDVFALLNAQNGGVDVRFVSLNIYENADEPTHAVITNEPEVQGPEDLEGRVVATNVQFNIDWVMMRQWMRLHGADPEALEFTEIPFPDQVTAVESRDVAAAGSIEPFYTIAESEDLRVVGNYFTEVLPVVPTAGVIAMQSYLEDNPDIARRFVRAIDRAVTDLIEDPDVARQLVTDNTPTPEEIIQQVRLQEWRLAAEEQTLTELIRFGQEEGLYERDFTLEDIIWEETRRE